MLAACAVPRALAQAPEAPLAPAAPPAAVAAPDPDFPYLPLAFGGEFHVHHHPELKLSGQVLFTATVNGYERILVLDLNGRAIRKLVDGPGNNSYAHWSPDGTKFAFTSDRDGNKEIYVAKWDGTDQRRLTFSPGEDDTVAWHPDGKHLVYAAEDGRAQDEVRTNIYIVPAEGGKTKPLTNFTSGRNTTPRFTRDGLKLGYSTNRFWPGWDVCLWNLETKQENCVLKGKQSYCRPVWSESGKIMSYSYGSGDQIGLGLAPTTDYKPRNLPNIPGREYDTAWGPGDRVMLFVNDGQRSGAFDMYAFNATQQVPTPLPLVTSRHSIRYLSWSPVKFVELEAKRLLEAEATPAPTSVPAVTNQAPPSSEDEWVEF